MRWCRCRSACTAGRPALDAEAESALHRRRRANARRALGVEHLELRNRAAEASRLAAAGSVRHVPQGDRRRTPKPTCWRFRASSARWCARASSADCAARSTPTVDRFFELYADNVHRHGTPPLREGVLRAPARRLRRRLRSADRRRPRRARRCAACCRFYFRDEVLPYYAGDCRAGARPRRQRLQVLGADAPRVRARPAHVRLRPQQARHRVVRLQEELGLRADAARTTSTSSTSATRVPQNNPLNPKYRTFIALWRRLPPRRRRTCSVRTSCATSADGLRWNRCSSSSTAFPFRRTRATRSRSYNLLRLPGAALRGAPGYVHRRSRRPARIGRRSRSSARRLHCRDAAPGAWRACAASPACSPARRSRCRTTATRRSRRWVDATLREQRIAKCGRLLVGDGAVRRSTARACAWWSTSSTSTPTSGGSMAARGRGRCRRSTAAKARACSQFERAVARAHGRERVRDAGGGDAVPRARAGGARAVHCVANGVDSDYFAPDANLRQSVRRRRGRRSCSPARWTTGRTSMRWAGSRARCCRRSSRARPRRASTSSA